MKHLVRIDRRPFSLTLMLVGVVLGIVPSARADSGLRLLRTVSPGESIQAAIDHAVEGGWVLVKPGTYQETADQTNGLSITRGIHLVGLSTPNKRVVLKNSGSQKNGIVAVPAAHTNCMSCHSSMAPPFALRPGVSRAVSNTPVIYGLSISGITIQDFINNGLFTRNLSGFAFVDVHSVGNKNYGRFQIAKTSCSATTRPEETRLAWPSYFCPTSLISGRTPVGSRSLTTTFTTTTGPIQRLPAES